MFKKFFYLEKSILFFAVALVRIEKDMFIELKFLLHREELHLINGL